MTPRQRRRGGRFASRYGAAELDAPRRRGPGRGALRPRSARATRFLPCQTRSTSTRRPSPARCGSRRRRRRAPDAVLRPRRRARRRGRLSRRAGVLRRGRGREPVLLAVPLGDARRAGAVAVLFGVLIYAKAQTDRRPYAQAQGRRPRRRRRRRAPRRDRARARRGRGQGRFGGPRRALPGVDFFAAVAALRVRPRRPPSPRSKSGGARFGGASESGRGEGDLRADGARPDRLVARRRPRNFERRRRRGGRRAYAEKAVAADGQDQRRGGRARAARLPIRRRQSRPASSRTDGCLARGGDGERLPAGAAVAPGAAGTVDRLRPTARRVARLDAGGAARRRRTGHHAAAMSPFPARPAALSLLRVGLESRGDARLPAPTRRR